jgi:hypothetical protein
MEQCERCVHPELGAQVGKGLDGGEAACILAGRQDLTNRTLPLAASAMKMPAVLATASAGDSSAAVAGPPSPA